MKTFYTVWLQLALCGLTIHKLISMKPSLAGHFLSFLVWSGLDIELGSQ